MKQKMKQELVMLQDEIIMPKRKIKNKVNSKIIEERIEQARMLLKELDNDKKESPFEKARRFLFIQESLNRLRKCS